MSHQSIDVANDFLLEMVLEHDFEDENLSSLLMFWAASILRFTFGSMWRSRNRKDGEPPSCTWSCVSGHILKFIFESAGIEEEQTGERAPHARNNID